MVVRSSKDHHGSESSEPVLNERVAVHLLLHWVGIPSRNFGIELIVENVDSSNSNMVR